MTLYELLEKPESWIKHRMALTANNEMPVHGRKACKWCLYGGILHVGEFGELGKRTRAVYEAIKKLFPERLFGSTSHLETISRFNDFDKTTHQDILAVIKESGC